MYFNGQHIPLEGPVDKTTGLTQIGIRPEFVLLTPHGLPATVRKVSDIGRHNVVELMLGDTSIKAIVADGPPALGDAVHVTFRQDHTRLYCDSWIASTAAGAP